ncbi:MAG TPA: tyrosine-protein phosphatase [Micromonosporaceae bacterium]
MTQRLVTFTDLYNFRDLGGYLTSDGRTVAWQRLFRSDDLGRLAKVDHDRFAALGIRTVVDLRRPQEVAEFGRVPQLTGLTYHHLHLLHPRWEPREFADVAERTAYLVERYGEMSAAGGEAIGAALRLIAQAQAAPLVVHCIAGKDRTGIISALVLSLLGVPDETIATDYALSDHSETAYRRSRDMPSAPFTVAPAAAMLTFLQGLRAEHGSVEGYVDSIGVTARDVAAMRAHLLS